MHARFLCFLRTAQSKPNRTFTLSSSTWRHLSSSNTQHTAASSISVTSSPHASMPLDFSEPIHILGAGSIGLLWAASIRSVFPAYPVQLLLRSHHEHRLSSEAGINSSKQHISICLQQPYGERRTAPRVVQVPAALIDDTASANGPVSKPIRNLILTTKAFQASSALESIHHRIHPTETRLIILCNGALAVRDVILKQFKGITLKHLHLAWTTHGAFRDEEETEGELDELFHVVHAGRGRTQIANYPNMAQLWDMAGLQCVSVGNESIEHALWMKLAANCVINPLTALHKCTNGELLKVPDFESQIMPRILEEVRAVASAEGVSLDTSEDSLNESVLRVIQETVNNKSSMWQDVRAKQQTEIDFLNGYIVAKAKLHGVYCPVNQDLVERIKSLC